MTPNLPLRRPSSSVWYRGGLPGQEKETAENDDDDEDEEGPEMMHGGNFRLNQILPW